MLPVIKEMRHKAEVIRRRELARTFRNLPGLDSSAREQIERLSQSLVNKLLHAPTVRLRGEATNGRVGEYVEAVRELFDLGVDESPAGDWPEPRAR